MVGEILIMSLVFIEVYESIPGPLPLGKGDKSCGLDNLFQWL
jgi:hypothetical protein